jgi:hypothetical protein
MSQDGDTHLRELAGRMRALDELRRQLHERDVELQGSTGILRGIQAQRNQADRDLQRLEHGWLTRLYYALVGGKAAQLECKRAELVTLSQRATAAAADVARLQAEVQRLEEQIAARKENQTQLDALLAAKEQRLAGGARLQLERLIKLGDQLAWCATVAEEALIYGEAARRLLQELCDRADTWTLATDREDHLHRELSVIPQALDHYEQRFVQLQMAIATLPPEYAPGAPVVTAMPRVPSDTFSRVVSFADRQRSMNQLRDVLSSVTRLTLDVNGQRERLLQQHATLKRQRQEFVIEQVLSD